MSTSLRWRLRLVLGALFAFAALPAAVHAQRMHAMPARPMTPMQPSQANMQPSQANMSMMMQQMQMMGHLPMGAAGTLPMQMSTMHNLNSSPTQTQRTALQDTQRAQGLDHGALVDTAAALLGNATPLLRAVLLNRASMLGGAAQTDRLGATLAGAPPLQKAAVLDRTARLDRALLNGTATLDGNRRMALFSAYNGGFNSNPYMPASSNTGSGSGGGSAMGSGGGYGMGSGGGYGSGGTQSNPSNPYTIPTSTAGPQAASPLDDTLGVPTSGGRLSWPLGLRVLPPTAVALRRQIDGIVQLAAAPSANGQLSPGAVELATDAAEQLRSMLRLKQGSPVMAESTYRDATEFLDRLEVSLLALKR